MYEYLSVEPINLFDYIIHIGVSLIELFVDKVIQ